MTRRGQKLSGAKSKTMWLAWLAWGIIGSIFVFEDAAGNSAWLTLLLTAPFWLMFAVWPFLWLWLKTRRNPNWVEMDDDIVAGDKTARLVQKDGVRYVDMDAFAAVFETPTDLPYVTLPGGDERFVKVDDVRVYAKKNAALAAWLEVVDSLAGP